MTYFDLDTAIKALGEGSDPIDAFSMAFGVPQCLIDIGKSAALALLPSDIVLSIANDVQKGRDSATEDVAKLKKRILMENGIFEIDTENGTYRFFSDFSKNGMDQQGNDAIGKIGGLTSSLAYALQAGSEIYTNYLEAKNILTGISDCIKTYQTFLKYQKGPSSEIAKALDPNYALNTFGIEIAKMNNSLDFISNADDVLNNCKNVLADRANNPELEPLFANVEIVSGLGLPYAVSSVGEREPIFRLVFGPPKSKKGQFLLSVDGLYYDSQSGGLPTVSAILPPEQAYKFDYDANLGGRGQAVSLKTLGRYIDTVFDLETIDESPSMREHYEADHFLSVLEGQKNKNLYDVSAQIQAAVDLGYSTSGAIIVNLNQSLYSIGARHESKIRRRKKQIEVAVKAPYLVGKEQFFSLGSVPINDFSFLKNLNLTVAYEKQKKLVVKQAEVSGVILPIVPKFVKASESESSVQMEHLVVPSVGTGAIIYDNDSIDSNATVLSLNDQVVKDGLIAIYNFLDGEIATPGSSEFNVLNCNSTNNYNNAQLVGKSITKVLNRGLAIPYLEGITKLGSVSSVSSLGSYVRLPDTTEFQNLAYTQKGFSFETWAYVPNIMESGSEIETEYAPSGYDASSFYRLLLSCENTGGINEEILNENQAPYSNNSDIVRGLVMGFSRDRQIVSNLSPDDTDSSNAASSTVFFLAPTRSVNSSEVGFINKESVINCVSGFEVLKCTLPLSTAVNSKYLSSVGSQFMHIAVTIDVLNNKVNIYVDGSLGATSSLQNVFGVPNAPPRVPSFKETNSFEYFTSSTGSTDFAYGPRLNTYFTPWILGGGYTDGNISNGGFMNRYSGLKSGLRGYVGSVKFYNRPLTNSEVTSNYDSQKGFFKNIEL